MSQQQGMWGDLVPSCQHLTNRDTAVTTRLGVLWLFKLELWEKLGTANGEIKKFNKQNRQSLRNASDPSALKFTGCANTVRKPFPWLCVLIPCTSLLSGMLSAVSFRGCSLDSVSYLGTGPYFSWDSVRKHFLKPWNRGEQHFLLSNHRVMGKVPRNFNNKSRKWSLLLSKHI